MNKLTKLMLATAVLATSGFATEIGIDAKTVFEAGSTAQLANGTKYVFANGAELHNYTTIECPASDGEKASFELESGATAASITNYKDQISEDDSFPKYTGMTGSYYRTQGNGQITGNYEIADEITVTEASSNAFDAISDLPVGTHTIVFVNDDDGTVEMSHADRNQKSIAHNLANELPKGSTYKAKNLKISGKFALTGNNSHFNADGTSVTLDGAEVTFSGANSLFDANITLCGNSVATISGADSFSKVLRVEGGKAVLAKEGFILKSGASLILESVVEYHITSLVNGEFYGQYAGGTIIKGAELYSVECRSGEIVVTNGESTVVYLLSSDEDKNLSYDSGVLDYSKLVENKTNTSTIYSGSCSYKELFEFLENIRTGVMEKEEA